MAIEVYVERIKTEWEPADIIEINGKTFIRVDELLKRFNIKSNNLEAKG